MIRLVLSKVGVGWDLFVGHQFAGEGAVAYGLEAEAVVEAFGAVVGFVDEEAYGLAG